jgi:hypothetical protein
MAAGTEIPFQLFKPLLLDQMKSYESVKTLRLETNAELPGKTERHRIDLYWEFRKAGKKHQAIIDVDHFDKWLSAEALVQSISVRDDLPCHPKEIFLRGINQGETINEFAKSNNITLIDPTNVVESQPSSGHMVYFFNIDIYQPYFKEVRFNQDEEWNRQYVESLGIPLNEASKIKIEGSDEIKFYDKNGKEVTTAVRLLNSLVPKGFEEMAPQRITHLFENPTFVETNDARARRAKIKSIEVTISKTHENKRFKIDFLNLVEHIIQTIVEGGVNTSILDKMMKSNPTIIGYSSTLKDEIVRDRPSGRKAIRIYVAKKKPKSELSEDQILPDTLDGIPVDVVEIGKPKLLQSSTIPTGIIRPLIGGISIGKNGLELGAGTLGYFVKDKNGYWYALSCQHVFGEAVNTPILQPGKYDAGRYPEDCVAKLSKSINNDFTDAAIARLDINAMPSMNGLLSPIGIGSAENQMKVIKSGRTTMITRGEIIDTTSVIGMVGKIYKDQIIIKSNTDDPFADHGDSGSLIIEERTNQAIGLLFAGDESVGTGIANHITDVLDTLDVELVGPQDDFR